MGLSVVVLIMVGLFLLKTRTGRATRAVSDNPALASASGIDVDRIIRLVWIIATALAGLSGVMLGLVLNGINWQTGMQLLLLMFAAVTLGGLGTAFGALVGSLIIGMTVELANLVLPGDFKYATALVLLIIVLLVRPQGIFGRKERIG
jgi:branched-chain amino acid transport system permease protein